MGRHMREADEDSNNEIIEASYRFSPLQLLTQRNNVQQEHYGVYNFAW